MTRRLLQPLLGALLTLALLVAYGARGALGEMVNAWESPEYSHAYLIPLIAAWIALQRLGEADGVVSDARWGGFGVVLLSLFAVLLGEYSALFVIQQYGLFLLLIGVVWGVLGWRAVAVLWPAWLYLAFAIPLPNFLYFNLSQALQLLSSEIGVAVIRVFDISVLLEGNVIDLGSFQLEVAEACSGLRYLFPLMSFGYLLAYLMQGPLWARAVVVGATLPIAVLLNSIRIGIVGILVEHQGIGAADGFLHYFEGWVIFLCCLGLLALVMVLLGRHPAVDANVADRMDVDWPRCKARLSEAAAVRMATPATAATLIAVLALAVAVLGAGQRTELTPDRPSFASFPLSGGGWLARERALNADMLSQLAMTDYFFADYRDQRSGDLVNLYVSYYDSQRSGRSVHSPKACIPGGGWAIDALDTRTLSIDLNGRTVRLDVQRALISRGTQKQVVYYWFEQRGRALTNEYLVKWFIFWDSLWSRRTDGAMVRMTVPLASGVDVARGDEALLRFGGDWLGQLRAHLPAGLD